MAFKFQAPKSFSASNWLQKEGKYHMSVLAIDESPKKADGSFIDGFVVECQVLAGTHQDEVKKTWRLVLASPDFSKSEKAQAMASLKQARFLRAVGLIRDGQEGQQIELDLQRAVARQFCIETERGGEDNKYLQMRGANLWHVDDPESAEIAKSQAALDTLTPGARLQSRPSTPNVSTAPATSKPARQPVAAAATTASSSMDEL